MEKTKLTEYLETHMLTPSVISAYGLKVSEKQISIPIRDGNGKLLFWKHRMFDGDAKYRYDRGSEMALFNADRIDFDTSVVWIVEGEFDAMALNSRIDSDQVAVSSTGGAGSWKEEWNALLAGMRVNVLLDSDAAGIEGAVRLWEKIGRDIDDVRICYIGNRSKDVCEMLSKGEPRIDSLFPYHVRFSYRDIAKAETWREKSKVLKSHFELLNETQAGCPSEMALAYLRKITDALMKVRDREKPRPKRVNPFPQDSDITIERIREIPIDRFVRFDYSNAAPCIFHDDSHPSMHWNPPGNSNPKLSNTVKCYSCGRFGGVIDVVMQLNNCGFVDAVEILKKQL